MAEIDSIKIKMYRQGFGDCFLLEFMDGNDRISSMLIDCGLKRGDHVDGVPMESVVKDIEDRVDARLDFLVITHEHWDHVSGFDPKKDLFQNFEARQVWMAWTEDPEDAVAALINQRLAKTAKALKIASKKIKKSTDENTALYMASYGGENYFAFRESFSDSLEDLLGFSNLSLDEGADIAVKKYKISEGTQAAMLNAAALAGNTGEVKYYAPGKIIEDRKKLPGIRIYVLGPPKNAKINKDRPSAKQKETYFSLKDASMDGFVNGLLGALDTTSPSLLEENGAPFNGVTAIRKEDAKELDMYKSSYYKQEESWRTIEDDWLDIGAALALQMDSDTNNTSLVLAIEFMGSGKVLLFPGDAQVGSWESWHDVSFKVKDGGQSTTVTASDLLKRTVLYKVSHHSSHNATLKELGLELMESEELVALVPEKQEGYKGIPYPPLVRRLEQKTKGRVIFSADVNYPAEELLEKKPKGLSQEEWEELKNNLKVEDLFIEYIQKA